MKEKTNPQIDAYIEDFREPIKSRLIDIRNTIQKAAPGATEKISYGMPTFYLNGNLVHFAGYAKHIGFYPTPSAIEAFQDELGAYQYAKGSVQFPHDKDLPLELIDLMVRFRVKENTK